MAAASIRRVALPATFAATFAAAPPVVTATPPVTTAAPPVTTAATAGLEAGARGCAVLLLAVIPLNLVGHLLTLLKVSAPVFAMHLAVDKDVLTAIVRSDETEALVLEELLYGSGGHGRQRVMKQGWLNRGLEQN